MFLIRITMDDGKTWTTSLEQGYYVARNAAQRICDAVNPHLGELSRAEPVEIKPGRLVEQKTNWENSVESFLCRD